MRTPAMAAIAVFTFATEAIASAPLDHDMIDRAVADFTGAGIGEPGGARLPVDRRLRLSPCPSAFDLTWFGRDRRSVQVACPAQGWRIYVAVDGAAFAPSTPTASRAASEPLVRRGETVSIVAQGRGFALTRQGEAVDNGAQGDWIRVRTTGAKAGTVRAQVLRPGQVGIDLP